MSGLPPATRSLPLWTEGCLPSISDDQISRVYAVTTSMFCPCCAISDHSALPPKGNFALAGFVIVVYQSPSRLLLSSTLIAAR